jgi:hypothetical protein
MPSGQSSRKTQTKLGGRPAVLNFDRQLLQVPRDTSKLEVTKPILQRVHIRRSQDINSKLKDTSHSSLHQASKMAWPA